MSLWAPLLFQIGLFGLLVAYAWPIIRDHVEREIAWRKRAAQAELQAKKIKLEQALARLRASRQRGAERLGELEQRIGADHPVSRYARALDEAAEREFRALEEQAEEHLRE